MSGVTKSGGAQRIAGPDLDARKIEEFLARTGVPFDAQSIRPTMPAEWKGKPILPCAVTGCKGPAVLNRDLDSIGCTACDCSLDLFEFVARFHGAVDEEDERKIVNAVCDGTDPKIDSAPDTAASDRPSARKLRKVQRALDRENKRAEFDGRQHDPSAWPFTILGTGDDGRVAFIGKGDRLHLVDPRSLTKLVLLNLAPQEFWADEFGFGDRIYWDRAIDLIVTISANRDFDTSMVRGRGAWRERDGRICYHDGKRTLGEHDESRLYVRRPRRDIGIEGPQLDPEIARAIEGICSSLSWSTPIDCVRMLGWAVAAPFAGALPWRPAILLTGESGSGKSTILDYVVNPMAQPLQVSGGESTEAGVRQRIGIDACGVTIDEAECDTDKKKRNREALFSLMRQSTSDDAPIVAKGTVDGKGQAFQLRSMFLFAAIDPTIEATADENRIFRINLRPPDSTKWPRIRAELVRLITRENCRQLRARTWALLPLIIRTADRFCGLIQDASGRDARYSLAEGLLQAAYWIVLCGRDGVANPELADDEFIASIGSLYAVAPPEARRDEVDELLDRILDERVQVEEPSRGTMSLREILGVVRSGQIESAPTLYDQNDDTGTTDAAPKTISHLRAVAARYGLAVSRDESLIFVAHNHHEIMRIAGLGRGYHRALARHRNIAEPSVSRWLGGKSRRCVAIRENEVGA
jgi:hypothetical protein